MPAALLLLAMAIFVPLVGGQEIGVRDAPAYTAASIVNAADNQPGPLAPNTIGSLYGRGLSYTTKALAPTDIAGGRLPFLLPGTGVTVLIGGEPANLYYVSPTQINFLVPANLLPGKSDLQVVLNGLAGPDVPLQIAASAPALFQVDAQTIIATRANGSLTTAASPAHPGDLLIVYATGLGDTNPPVVYSSVSASAAPLKRIAEFRILLDGTPIDPKLIAYAGIAPGYAGLYQ